MSVERAVRRLIRAGRAALHAQERYYHWTQFGTNSSRARQASKRWDEAFAALERAEADVEESIFKATTEGI